MDKRKRTNNDAQHTTQKTKNKTTWIGLKPGHELFESGSSSCSTSDTRCVTRVTNEVVRDAWEV
jgi:hypothetical protein